MGAQQHPEDRGASGRSSFSQTARHRAASGTVMVNQSLAAGLPHDRSKHAMTRQ
jgi:hypothetical protein